MEKDDEKPLNGQGKLHSRGVITIYAKWFTAYAIGCKDVKSKDDHGIDDENTAPLCPR